MNAIERSPSQLPKEEIAAAMAQVERAESDAELPAAAHFLRRESEPQ